MKIGTKIALAAIVVASFAAPALAGEWVYHGGPKSPDSLTSYVPQVYYGGPYADPYRGYGYRYEGPEADY
jgi:hypothetical protein